MTILDLQLTKETCVQVGRAFSYHQKTVGATLDTSHV